MFHLIVLLATVAPGARAPAPAPAAPSSTGAAAAAAAAVAPPGTTTVIPFRTDAQPRIDPVFGDAAALRAAVDRFAAIEAEMQRARDDLSTAVHETLATLAGGAAATAAPRSCPVASGAPYVRAVAAGTRYLALGQQLQSRYRDIRRADELGDGVALTPDYRARIKHAKDLYQQRLTEYRELRVAFYDQLGAELRHAACKPAALEALAAQVIPDPPSPDADTDTAAPAAPGGGKLAPAPASAPAISIAIDNSLCPLPTRVSIDGQTLGLVEARQRASLRTRAGPREICALPTSDSRTCGDAGTVRRAYLHEGWSLAIRCER